MPLTADYPGTSKHPMPYGGRIYFASDRDGSMMTPASGGAARHVVVEPISQLAEWDLRYHEWEYTRRLAVEEMGGGDIGYVHLREEPIPDWEPPAAKDLSVP